MDAPLATLGFTDNYNVEVTCFTWVGCNRLALGHTDGSITLWSIYPTQILQRHAVHASHVLDISSGYPSMPHMVASVPVGGFTTLTDLSNPTCESTYVAAPGIQFQPGMLDWSDHLQGWLVLAPAGGPGLNTLVFLSVRYFPLARSMMTSMSMPLCVSVCGNHPFALVGCADGSVWSFNALSKLFRQRDEDAFKIKIFEHEFRPVDSSPPADVMEVDDLSGDNSLRGASRILQAFLPQVNDDPRSERLRELNKKKLQAAVSKKKGAAKGKNKGKAASQQDGGGDGGAESTAAGGGLDDVSAHMASRMVIHEPLTRVTATAWNPNVEFASWAAVALGSGLVRILDVGVE
jgi:transcription factor C subunit 6